MFFGVLIKNMKSVFVGRHRKSDFFPDFLPIFNIKRQLGTRGESEVSGVGGGGGGGEPNIKQIVKKKIVQKISKICEIGKNRKNLIFFY